MPNVNKALCKVNEEILPYLHISMGEEGLFALLEGIHPLLCGGESYPLVHYNVCVRFAAFEIRQSETTMHY